MKKSAFPLFLILLAFVACVKKELPIQESEEPVFHLSCDIDGMSQHFEAGNNDYFMNTNWGLDSQNVYFVRGDLSQVNSSLAPNYGISLTFNNTYSSSINTSVSVDSLIKLGPHLLNDLLITGSKQTIHFTPEKKFESASSYQWTVIDGDYNIINTSTDYVFSTECSIGKTYSVSLKYEDGFGCVSTHTNVFKAGSNLQTKISAIHDTSSSELNYSFKYSVPYPGAKLSCSWKFSDGTYSSMNPTPAKLYNPGTYIIGLRLIDLNSLDTCLSYYQLNATNNITCDANFSASFEEVVNTNIFATTTVLLTDGDGTVYSSRNAVQPASSNFEIISVSDYKPNANGYPTKSLNVRFTCVVQNGQKQKTISNATAVMAVAYKP